MKFRRYVIAELALLALLVCAVLASGARGDKLHAQAADTAPTDINALKAQMDALQRQLPDQAHAMSDVDYHFSSLWFAAQNGNWPLADVYLGETRSHLIRAVRLRPVPKLSTGADLDLAPILLGVQLSGLADLKGAVDKHDAHAFELAYRGMMSQCYGCHVAAEKPYLRVRAPETPGAHMIDPHG
jgi:hypothetical protein